MRTSVAAFDVSADAGSSRRIDVRVPADPVEVSQVRHALDELGLPDDVLGDAQLLVSELVTNSIKHSGMGLRRRVRIRALWDRSKLRIDVFDGGDGRTMRVAGGIRPSPTGESGWGLYLLDRIASRWGNSPGHYWFELAASSTGRAASA
jgi:anti-sigma regulatory factor (Ser/Thr protein kinase)